MGPTGALITTPRGVSLPLFVTGFVVALPATASAHAVLASSSPASVGRHDDARTRRIPADVAVAAVPGFGYVIGQSGQ